MLTKQPHKNLRYTDLGGIYIPIYPRRYGPGHERPRNEVHKPSRNPLFYRCTFPVHRNDENIYKRNVITLKNYFATIYLSLVLSMYFYFGPDLY